MTICFSDFRNNQTGVVSVFVIPPQHSTFKIYLIILINQPGFSLMVSFVYVSFTAR